MKANQHFYFEDDQNFLTPNDFRKVHLNRLKKDTPDFHWPKHIQRKKKKKKTNLPAKSSSWTPYNWNIEHTRKESIEQRPVTRHFRTGNI